MSTPTVGELMARLERIQRKLIAARLECQQLRSAHAEPYELARLRDGGRPARAVRWILKLALQAKDFLMSFVKRDQNSWGPRFVPYRIKPREPAGRARYHVFHFLGNFAIGGSTQLVVDLIERLGSDYMHSVFCPQPPRSLPYQGIQVYPIKTPADLARLDQLLREARPDLVHVHLWRSPWYAQIFRVLEAHRCPVVENINVPVAPFVSPVVQRYVYVSEFVRREFSPETPDDIVVYPGMDLSHFRPRRHPVTQPCLGMAYRLNPDKLNDGSILPFIHAVRRDPAFEALVVGDGPLMPSFRTQVAQHGVTRSFDFPGYVSYADLPSYLDRMSVFIAPVHSESFGQITLFAMAQGIPVVGYRIGALPEIVDDPELLVDPGDFARLGDLALALARDPGRIEHIRERNRRRVAELFGVDQMIAHYRQIYREVIDRTERPLLSQSPGAVSLP